jgi:hypothetical protein
MLTRQMEHPPVCATAVRLLGSILLAVILILCMLPIGACSSTTSPTRLEPPPGAYRSTFTFLNITDEPRFRRAFGAPRYRVCYRHWLRAGESLINALLFPVLPDAIARGTGRVETHVLRQPCHHLSPLVGTA